MGCLLLLLLLTVVINFGLGDRLQRDFKHDEAKDDGNEDKTSSERNISNMGQKRGVSLLNLDIQHF